MELKIYKLIYLTLLSFSMTAIWLYSAGFKEIKEAVISLENSKFFILRKLSYLGICSLCSGFWFSILLQIHVCGYYTLKEYIFNSLIVGGVVWIMCSYINSILWKGPYYEKKYMILDKEDKREN